MIHLPDLIELSERRIDRLEALYVDEFTCMNCSRKVDYTLLCMTHDGPAMCMTCCGLEEPK